MKKNSSRPKRAAQTLVEYVLVLALVTVVCVVVAKTIHESRKIGVKKKKFTATR